MSMPPRGLDPFTAPLDRLSYEDIFEAFAFVGSESQRLEFKRELDTERVARSLAAMANGSGGLVIIGFVNPTDGKPLERFPFTAAIDEPARRALLSSIQAKVYPSLPIDCGGYISQDRTHQILVFRTATSLAAPHELLNARGRFETRRGTEVQGLTLRELENLIARRDSSAINDSDHTHLPHPMISLDRSVPEHFVGIRILPERGAVSDEPLGRTLQNTLVRRVHDLHGLNATMEETTADGFYMMSIVDVSDGAVLQDQARYERFRRRAYVDASGGFELRDTVICAPFEEMMLTVLCNGYAFGSYLFRELGLGPRGHAVLSCHREVDPGSVVVSGDFTITVNFSLDAPVDFARKPLMYALRIAKVLVDANELNQRIAEFWRLNYAGIFGKDMRSAW